MKDIEITRTEIGRSYEKRINYIEYTHIHGEAYWGYLDKNEVRRSYDSIEKEIENDKRLVFAEEREFLKELINEKRRKIPETEKLKEKDMERREKEHSEAVIQAKERYSKLNALKKAILFLKRQNPSDEFFYHLEDYEINNLYTSKKRK